MHDQRVDLRRIEECSLNALPALQQVLLDGWVLRAAAGYSRRANSVNPFYPSQGDMDMDAKIGLCERFYQQRALTPIFRLTPFSPPELAARLEARGYARSASTWVMWAAVPEAAPQDASIRALDMDEWIAVSAHIAGQAAAELEPLRAILGHIWPAQRLLALWDGNEPVACGRAVLEEQYIGLFSIETAAAQRRRGHARRLVSALLAWGQAQGAKAAYLQVHSQNTPARCLYDDLGFQLGYEYRYYAAQT